ncbi:hypothetical protein B0H13DRAFT_2226465 [Mycena leptocephala]|nr:hypothetical protein B0H13DRAFT_2226465 [Mycena leptocephala]
MRVHTCGVDPSLHIGGGVDLTGTEILWVIRQNEGDFGEGTLQVLTSNGVQLKENMGSTHLLHRRQQPRLTWMGQGLFPCSPFAPKLAVTTRVLEMFRVNRLRCPLLSIQSWAKSLCDLHGRPYMPYLSQQFSICFDLYLEILGNVDQHVAKELGRDGPDWRLKNCCPACTYKLEGEKKLIFSMLLAMDGNDSLKRVLRKDKTFDEEGNPTRGWSQRPDPRSAGAGSTYWIDRDKVDLWAKELIQGLVEVPVSQEGCGLGRCRYWRLRQIIDDPGENSACQERWKNLKEDMTSRMWGVFDETGVFLALCRHGFVLLLADMVRSRELAKYPLAIVDALLDAFGPDVGFGYDIGCGFGKTANKSPLPTKAEELNFKSLVGAFHGHAHNCLCQLAFLATYVLGMGLEDLEGCERFFSKSNALARSTRYASIFHRRQTIATCTFLVNNYKQALELLDGAEALAMSMSQLGIQEVSEFHDQLKDEMEYLKGLGKEPEEETNQMEYFKWLVILMERNINTCTMATMATREKFDTVCSENSKSTATAKRHAREGYDRALLDVEESERKMEIVTRWEWESKEWEDAATLVNTRKYRLCINELEALVLKRMFELTKMNMSGTGYKLRKHIAKALQARSQAIKNALNRYNTAAAALNPPRCPLSWNEVIDYTFLSEWDLLRDPDANSRLRPWATPTARLVLDMYFKIERAQEEVDRLNIEMRRFVTYMRDEKQLLDYKVREVSQRDPNLAFFIQRYQWRRGRFDDGHMARLTKLAQQLGPRFTGTLVPGKRVMEPVKPEDMEGIEVEDEDLESDWGSDGEQERSEDDEEGWEDEEGEEAEGEELAEMMETVLTLATDGVDLPKDDE